MMSYRRTLLLTLLPILLSACQTVQSTELPTLPVQTQNTESVIQPTPTVYVKSTEFVQTQTGTPSPIPSLFDNLPPGMYLAISGNEGSGWNSIPSIHLLSQNGQDVGILAEYVPNTATTSPDGSEIAFVHFTQPPVSNLAVLNLPANTIKYFSISGCGMPDGTVGWSPDGAQVAVSCGDYISVVDITGEKAMLVSALKIANGNQGQLIDQVAWSPDGNFLSFYVADIQDAQDSSSHGPYLINPKCPNDVTECQISPYSLEIKDSSIAKWTSDNLLAIAQNNRIYLFNPVTKQLAKSVFLPVDTQISSFAWSPDNQLIAYSVKNLQRLTEEIYTVSSSGGEPILLANDGNDVMFWMQTK